VNVWSKVFVVAPNGGARVSFGEPSPKEAMRRSLERCGYEYSQACMVVAIGDTFVVAVPTVAKVVGFYRPNALTSVQPDVRDDIARRLANANSGWNAVAVGANGQVGIKIGAGSEQAAVDGALEECAKHDRECHIAVIGPFLVEPEADRAPANAASPQ
jgi:adenylate cyclase